MLKGEQQMIRWGILGAGRIADRFAAALELEDNCVLYAISGRDEEKLNAFKEKHTCEKVYLSHGEMLKDPDIDAVYVAVPHHMHREWSIKALNAKKPVLCEKPAALNEQEVIEITECARANDVLFMEALKSRTEPAYIQLKKELKEGLIGEITHTKTQFCYAFPREYFGKTYLTQPEAGGGLLDVGVYCLSWPDDLFTGDMKVDKICGNVYNGLDTYLDVHLRYENGTAEIITGLDRPLPTDGWIEGTKGSVYMKNMHRPESYTVTLNGQEPYTVTVPYRNGNDFCSEIHHFVSLLEERKTESDLVSFEASIRLARQADTIRKTFTEYSMEDLRMLEMQEKILQYPSFENEDALILGNRIAELDKEYSMGVAIRIIRESDGMIMFQYVTKDKREKNFEYAEMKRKASLACGHSSAWANIAMQVKESGYVNPEGALPAGGAFPIRTKDGTLQATVLVSGLHEGKDHELILRALCEVLEEDVPVPVKVIG